MARVTVEDCITKVTNRFDLVLLASQRARQLAFGSLLTISRDNDKNPVVALREIAVGNIAAEDMQTSVIHNYRQYQAKPDAREEELDAILTSDKSMKSKNVEIGVSEKTPAAPKKLIKVAMIEDDFEDDLDESDENAEDMDEDVDAEEMA